jgi:hypothetical protein
MPNPPGLQGLVDDFINRITAIIDARAQEQARIDLPGDFRTT